MPHALLQFNLYGNTLLQWNAAFGKNKARKTNSKLNKTFTYNQEEMEEIKRKSQLGCCSSGWRTFF